VTPPSLQARLARRILADGPISVERFMAEANAHYYAGRDPLGRAGDFVTASEVSQMFGELVGACLADLWIRAGRPPAHYVELGPGRGTLAADALRAMRGATFTPPVHFVETSPVLATIQADLVPQARIHASIATLPADAPLLIVANEFLDALPIRQFLQTDAGWRERMIGWSGSGFVPVPGLVPVEEAVPAALRQAPLGSIVETSPVALELVAQIAERLAAQGGAAIFIDYGHTVSAAGETLQAVTGHAYAEPFADPGGRDLTAHVDFAAIAQSAQSAGLTIAGPVAQGRWLEALGIAARAATLAKAAPARAAEIAAAHARLTRPEQMGSLFKAMAIIAPTWPQPAGF
jgi:NADH dehydrogenase [ubiquinone] 1 alpha subcomplex assembly factor 7